MKFVFSELTFVKGMGSRAKGGIQETFGTEETM